MCATSLTPEWERIDVLGSCLANARQGVKVPQDLQTRLKNLQASVQQVRQQPPWQQLIRELNLTPMDQDIFACVVAPVAEPRLGWMYQELQSGVVSAYPNKALLHELLFMDELEAQELNSCLQKGAPLVRHGYIETQNQDSYVPIRPTVKASEVMLGWKPEYKPPPPGATKIESPNTFNDLVLPDYCLRGIHEFMNWIKYREVVEKGWGARVTGGPVALFLGPPGTGKTFSATVIANELEWPLYRVDLGKLVSKYIGETEKNLNALFDAANNKKMILLFDEAESLFGKRGELKDARDRYANMEVSHLLSRIELHYGPCILTSNLGKQLDPAFARRFQIVVQFPLPSSEQQSKLWSKHIPPDAPVSNELDYQRLGETLNLSGGQIRNAVLHAAFLAAAESTTINLQHVARAVWVELNKEGCDVTHSSLGFLVDYLNRETTSDQNPLY